MTNPPLGLSKVANLHSLGELVHRFQRASLSAAFMLRTCLSRLTSCKLFLRNSSRRALDFSASVGSVLSSVLPRLPGLLALPPAKQIWCCPTCRRFPS